MINDVSMTLKICHFLFFNVNGELQMILETKISNSQLSEIIRLFEAVFFFKFGMVIFLYETDKIYLQKITQISKIHNIQNGYFFNRRKKSRSRT